MSAGAQIISCKIGDSRLGSMETMTGLTRALVAALDHEVDLINMSYGEVSNVAASAVPPIISTSLSGFACTTDNSTAVDAYLYAVLLAELSSVLMLRGRRPRRPTRDASPSWRTRWSTSTASYTSPAQETVRVDTEAALRAPWGSKTRVHNSSPCSFACALRLHADLPGLFRQ